MCDDVFASAAFSFPEVDKAGVAEEDPAGFLEGGAEVVEFSLGTMLTSVLVVSRSASCRLRTDGCCSSVSSTCDVLSDGRDTNLAQKSVFVRGLRVVPIVHQAISKAGATGFKRRDAR